MKGEAEEERKETVPSFSTWLQRCTLIIQRLHVLHFQVDSFNIKAPQIKGHMHAWLGRFGACIFMISSCLWRNFSSALFISRIVFLKISSSIYRSASEFKLCKTFSLNAQRRLY